MQYWTLVEKIRDVLKDDADITAWCQAHYGQDHALYIEYDDENPPPDSSYPIIVIMPDAAAHSLDAQYGDFYVNIGYAIKETGKTALANVTEYTGVEMLFDFIRLAEAALFSQSADLGGAWIESREEALDLAYPLWRSVVNYGFKNPDRMDPIV